MVRMGATLGRVVLLNVSGMVDVDVVDVNVGGDGEGVGVDIEVVDAAGGGPGAGAIVRFGAGAWICPSPIWEMASALY